jgi:putative membrane protein
MPDDRDTLGLDTGRREPARINEHLANERTFLAWVRTSIAIIGLGFVMAKFSVWLRQFVATVTPSAHVPAVGASLPAGLVLISFGAIIALLAYWRYRAIERAIDSGEYAPARALLVLVTTVIVAISFAVVLYLLESTRNVLGTT